MYRLVSYSLILLIVCSLILAAHFDPGTQLTSASPSILNTTTPLDNWMFLPMVNRANFPCSTDDLIAFTSTELQQREIGLICSDGSGRRVITYTPGFESVSPSWAPDKTRLAFTSNKDGMRGIYIYDLGCECILSGKIPIDMEAYFPAWSPDGQRIAFDSPDGIHAVNTDGSGLIRLTEQGSVPTWSPDGTRIAYFTWDKNRRVIRIHEVGGTGYTQLPTPGSDYTPAWSPDGTKIAFASGQDNTVDIYLINVDGTGLTQLTDMPTYEYSPSWSPDGTELTFVVYSMENVSISIMNADGTGLRTLAPQADSPAWGD